jgi:hypothetical protein
MTAVPMPEVEKGLQLIRVRRRRMIYVFLGFFPVMLVTGYIIQLFSHSETPVIFAAIAYGGLFSAYGFRLAFTECPRCRGLYHWNWWSNPWT